MKILWRSDKDKNTFKAIEKHRYGLRKTISKHLNKRTDFMLSTAYSCFCSLIINKLHQERILRCREGNAQSSPWGHVNFTKAIFRPIKPVKLTWSLFPKRSANFYSVLHIHWKEFNSRRSREIVIVIWQPSSKYFELFGLLWGSRAWTWWRFHQSIKMCARLRNETSKTVYLWKLL